MSIAALVTGILGLGVVPASSSPSAWSRSSGSARSTATPAGRSPSRARRRPRPRGTPPPPRTPPRASRRLHHPAARRRAARGRGLYDGGPHARVRAGRAGRARVVHGDLNRRLEHGRRRPEQLDDRGRGAGLGGEAGGGVHPGPVDGLRWRHHLPRLRGRRRDDRRCDIPGLPATTARVLGRTPSPTAARPSGAAHSVNSAW